MMATNTSRQIKSGYDLPLTGLDDGTFLSIHVLALVCISLSFICVIFTLIINFSSRTFRSFFQWPKGNRLVIYLAICDGLFNLVHALDHLQIVITNDHVRPRALCVFYAATLGEFSAAQVFMVNIVCINAFLLMYFKKNLDFGCYDYKLLLFTFGVPLIAVIIFICLGTFGASGLYCGFDQVKGRLSYLIFLTIPLITVLTSNTILYTLTWIQIRREEKSCQLSNNKKHISSVRASHRAARSMSLFVAAFFIQWCPLAIFGVVPLVSDHVPAVLNYFTTTCSNIGGILNGAVYLIIRRKTLTQTSSHSNS